MARTWLITGCSRGFGRDLAVAALQRGDKVLATARDPRSLTELVAEHPATAAACALDVTDPHQAERAVGRAIDRFGRLDVVANNAGYANSIAIEDMPLAEFRAQLETNLFGLVNVTRAALPVLRTQRSGHFLQFSSVAGRFGGTPGLGAYQASKFAIAGFSEVLAVETRPFGVKVTIVEPGSFRTGFVQVSSTAIPVSPDYEDTVGARRRLRRSRDGAQPGDPARAAQAILTVVDAPDPPLRLLLGSDAVTGAARAAELMAEEGAKWLDLSLSTDHQG